MRVAIYVRVSSREQKVKGYSISAQLRQLRKFAESQDWNIVGEYIDPGVSAKDMNRPQLLKMLKDVENGHIDVVLVKNLDRLTRSVSDLYDILEHLEKYDCKFKSATEVYDTTTAVGRMFITIVSAIAQWERENLGERISFGLAEKAQQGKYPNGLPPFGYKVENSKLIINEEEARIVRLIFDKYLSGYGLSKIARHLNQKGITTRTGAKWHKTTIEIVLESQHVRGHTEWAGEVHKHTHEPIIDENTIRAYERVLEQRRKQIKTNSVSSDYLFSGLIQCYNCGANLHGNKTKGKNGTIYYSYRCPNQARGVCKENGTRASEFRLEEQFIGYISRVDFSEVINEVEINEEKDDTIDSLLKELEKIEKRKKKWQFAWVNEIISDDDLRKRMKEETKKEERIRNELIHVEKPKVELNKEEAQKVLQDIEKNWNALTRREKKVLIQSIVKKIEYKKVGRDTVLTNICFNM